MSRLRIVVAGLIGSFPMSGVTMHWLQYVLGLRKLGHEVLYVEDTGAWYYDPRSDRVVDDVSVPLAHLKATMDAFDLADSWAFIDHRGVQHGVSGDRFDRYLKSAELLVHVTGAMYLHERYMRIARRAYVDTDPGFVQFRAAGGSERDLEHLGRHTAHFSYGCNIGSSDCTVPTLGLDWQPTVQPLCLEHWPVTPPPAQGAPFTTVIKWHGYAPETHEGQVYGLKDVEFLRFVELPGLVDQPLELAMAGRPPVDDLASHGWRCRPGLEVSSTVEAYGRYIRGSRGEWSVAKNGYVRARSGWFSDRSAAYLASGRPVILQSTGYERWLPTGIGVHAFGTLDEARGALESVAVDYPRNCHAARELAETWFRDTTVLDALVETAMAARAPERGVP